MNMTFYISGVIAVLATFMAITRREAIHGLVYLVVSLLAAAVAFLVLGAPFAAALEVITYAGAMMVMLLFVMMTLTPKTRNRGGDMSNINPWSWLGPALMTLLLAGDFVYIIMSGTAFPASGIDVSPRQVGQVLFGPYVLGVELASMLLLAGLVGAYHLGHQDSRKRS
jgi:NADH-quinone oxidoreductase subunit J